MRLEHYLKEGYKLPEPDQFTWDNHIMPTLKAECKQFLKEGVMLYRGRKWDEQWDMELIKPRKNRKPVDSPHWLHDGFDYGSKKVYGFKARSEGVFATRNQSVASGYGVTQIFVPRDGYKYIWSENIADLFDKRDDLKQDPAAYGIGKDFNKEFWEDFVRNFYQNNNLKRLGEKSEVMFYCPKGYYIVPMVFEEAIEEEFGLK